MKTAVEPSFCAASADSNRGDRTVEKRMSAVGGESDLMFCLSGDPGQRSRQCGCYVHPAHGQRGGAVLFGVRGSIPQLGQ